MHIPDIQRVIELIAERKIEEAMEEGAFDNLPGAGKPLPLDEEWFVPPEMRPAIRLMKSAGVLPDWMERAREIERLRDECAQLWRIAEREYPRVLTMGHERFQIWRTETWARIEGTMKRVNSLILAYNCTAPSTAVPLIPYGLEREYARFCEQFPWTESL